MSMFRKFSKGENKWLCVQKLAISCHISRPFISLTRFLSELETLVLFYGEMKKQNLRKSSSPYVLPDKLGFNLLDGILRHFVGRRYLVGQLLFGNLWAYQPLCHLPQSLHLPTFVIATAREWSRTFRTCKEMQNAFTNPSSIIQYNRGLMPAATKVCV